MEWIMILFERHRIKDLIIFWKLVAAQCLLDLLDQDFLDKDLNISAPCLLDFLDLGWKFALA